MDRPVEISVREWTEHVNDVKDHEEKIEHHDLRLNRHSDRIKKLEESTNELPHAIQKAVSDGMEKVLSKVLELDKQFELFEREKLALRAIKAEKELEAQAEKKKYYRRIIVQTIVGCFITSVVGGILSFYVSVFLNNL